jgi:hypothetical protein
VSATDQAATEVRCPKGCEPSKGFYVYQSYEGCSQYAVRVIDGALVADRDSEKVIEENSTDSSLHCQGCQAELDAEWDFD